MPKIHTNDGGDMTIRWGIVEKVLGGVITTLSCAALIAAIGVFVRVAVLEEKVDRNETAIAEGGFVTNSDVNTDRITRATHEAAVLEALTNIQTQQVEQTKLLADLQARMTSVEQGLRDAREERMRIEDRLDNN